MPSRTCVVLKTQEQLKSRWILLRLSNTSPCAYFRSHCCLVCSTHVQHTEFENTEIKHPSGMLFLYARHRKDPKTLESKICNMGYACSIQEASLRRSGIVIPAVLHALDMLTLTQYRTQHIQVRYFLSWRCLENAETLEREMSNLTAASATQDSAPSDLRSYRSSCFLHVLKILPLNN